MIAARSLPAPADAGTMDRHREIVERAMRLMNIDLSAADDLAAQLPFSPEDTTCGLENEFQAVVIGDRSTVDLPRRVCRSACYRNAQRNTDPAKCFSVQQGVMEDYLSGNRSGVWENSWVTFDRDRLNLHAYQVLDADLHKDKSNPMAGYRSDKSRFLYRENGRDIVRVPVSYLMKLAFADASGSPGTHRRIRFIARKMMESYVSDNSSPEVLSFYPTGMKRSGQTVKPVKETAIRYLLSQFLIAYANRKFGLKDAGQTARVYFSSHTPVRLKQFNNGIPDALYRELFMSPCLSGWDRGEDKLGYMHLCHRVLSRSRMNAVTRLKDAGLITSNLIVMPNISDASLANNGTHISLGSRKLTRLLNEKDSGFTDGDEKYLGDLVIKIFEHFIPLFVGTYSATPYRLDFQDFHPERVLGFLPHELEGHHVRWLWKLWKKKAGLRILNQPLTPFGPEALDRFIGRLFFLKGDTVPDFRLLDYFASLPSTGEHSPLDGTCGNEARLSADLQEMGIFDARMPMYLLMRMRKASQHGFSGFEGRYYSTFESLLIDLNEAVQLQRMILSFAYKLVFQFNVTHADIPDTPQVESQRRQIIFGAAVGLDHIVLEKHSDNRFLSSILETLPHQGPRALGYKRKSKTRTVSIRDYRLALVRLLETQGADILRSSGKHSVLRGLRRRISYPEHAGVSAKLTRTVLEKNGWKSPYRVSAETFNTAMEACYRDDLRKRHMAEGGAVLANELHRLDLWAGFRDPATDAALKTILGNETAESFFESHQSALLTETADEAILEKAIQLIVLTVSREAGLD